MEVTRLGFEIKKSHYLEVSPDGWSDNSFKTLESKFWTVYQNWNASKICKNSSSIQSFQTTLWRALNTSIWINWSHLLESMLPNWICPWLFEVLILIIFKRCCSMQISLASTICIIIRVQIKSSVRLVGFFELCHYKGTLIWTRYSYALFKHTFISLLNVWNPDDEKTDDIIGKLLSELHQVDQIFYHWSWYIFPRVLEFYSDPSHKLRFLFKYGIEINAKDHSWDNLLDCPTKISLSRRPRPIIQLLFRTGLYYSFDHGAWAGLVEKLKLRDVEEPGFLDEFWKQFEIELTESRHSSLWESDGKDFEGESGRFSNWYLSCLGSSLKTWS